MELVGGFHGVLAGHGVGDKQDLGGIEQFFERGKLGHQIFVDVQAARGIDQQDVAAGLHGFLARGAGQIERLGFFRRAFVDGKLQIARQNAQLLARRGAIDVDRDHDRRIAVLRQPARELRGRGGFAGALQADNDEDAGRLVGHAQAGPDAGPAS